MLLHAIFSFTVQGKWKLRTTVTVIFQSCDNKMKISLEVCTKAVSSRCKRSLPHTRCCGWGIILRDNDYDTLFTALAHGQLVLFPGSIKFLQKPSSPVHRANMKATTKYSLKNFGLTRTRFDPRPLDREEKAPIKGYVSWVVLAHALTFLSLSRRRSCGQTLLSYLLFQLGQGTCN